MTFSLKEIARPLVTFSLLGIDTVYIHEKHDLN
jgi:hypothetical protein